MGRRWFKSKNNINIFLILIYIYKLIYEIKTKKTIFLIYFSY